MSLGYKDGNYPSESQVPIYTSQDVTAKYAVKLRLKGELLVSGGRMDDRLCVMRSWPACFSLIRLRISPSLYVQGRYEAGDFRFVTEEPVLSISLMIVPTSLLVNYTSIYLSIWPVRRRGKQSPTAD